MSDKTIVAEEQELVEAVARAIEEPWPSNEPLPQHAYDKALAVIPIIRQHEREKIAREMMQAQSIKGIGWDDYHWPSVQAWVRRFFSDHYGIEPGEKA